MNSITRVAIVLSAALTLCLSAGCKQGASSRSNSASSPVVTVELPGTNPPVLNKALVGRVRKGMSQDEALSVLQNATQNAPAAKSALDPALENAKSNPNRHQLILKEGTRQLAVMFDEGKVSDVAPEGI